MTEKIPVIHQTSESVSLPHLILPVFRKLIENPPEDLKEMLDIEWDREDPFNLFASAEKPSNNLKIYIVLEYLFENVVDLYDSDIVWEFIKNIQIFGFQLPKDESQAENAQGFLYLQMIEDLDMTDESFENVEYVSEVSNDNSNDTTPEQNIVIDNIFNNAKNSLEYINPNFIEDLIYSYRNLLSDVRINLQKDRDILVETVVQEFNLVYFLREFSKFRLHFLSLDSNEISSLEKSSNYHCLSEYLSQILAQAFELNFVESSLLSNLLLINRYQINCEELQTFTRNLLWHRINYSLESGYIISSEDHLQEELVNLGFYQDPRNSSEYDDQILDYIDSLKVYSRSTANKVFELYKATMSPEKVSQVINEIKRYVFFRNIRLENSIGQLVALKELDLTVETDDYTNDYEDEDEEDDDDNEIDGGFSLSGEF